MCERCNPLGLKQPAASQAHGTASSGSSSAVIVLFVSPRSRSRRRSIPGRRRRGVSAPPGLAVTLTVTNQGTSTGSTTCRIFDPSMGAGPESTYADSPQVPAAGRSRSRPMSRRWATRSAPGGVLQQPLRQARARTLATRASGAAGSGAARARARRHGRTRPSAGCRSTRAQARLSLGDRGIRPEAGRGSGRGGPRAAGRGGSRRATVRPGRGCRGHRMERDLLQRTVAGQDRRRRAGTPAGQAGEAVGGVSDEGQPVRDRGRLDAHFARTPSAS